MIDLDELEKLANLAKPLPWCRHNYFTDYSAPMTDVRTIQGVLVGVMVSREADYIIAACNAVPALIERIRELEKELDAAIGYQWEEYYANKQGT